MKTALAEGLKLLVRTDRFEAEIKGLLIQRGFEDAEVETALRQISAWGLLSNERAERNLVEAHLNRGDRGRSKLAHQLVKHGVEPEEATTVAAQHIPDELERVRAFAFLAENPKLQDQPSSAFRRLVNRGFDPEIAQEVVESWCGATE